MKKTRSKRTPKGVGTSSNHLSSQLLEEARQAHAEYNFERAIELYTQALEQAESEGQPL